MLRWFRRRWVKRSEYDAVTAIYECRIEALEYEVDELRKLVKAKDPDASFTHTGLSLLRQTARNAHRTS